MLSVYDIKRCPNKVFQHMKTTTDGALYPNKKASRAQTAALQLTHFYTQYKEEKSGCCHFLNYTIGGIF